MMIIYLFKFFNPESLEKKVMEIPYLHYQVNPEPISWKLLMVQGSDKLCYI